jgi:hypothetical protein
VEGWMLHLFGDESCFDTAISYAVTVIPPERQAEIEAAFGEVKACFGGPRAARIHCRELFSGEQRKKSPWAHLSPPDLFPLLVMTGNYLRLSGARFKVGLIDTRDVGQQFSGVGSIGSHPAGQKQLVAYAHVAALAGIEKYPGGEEIKLWKDPDKTLIEWGDKRRQAGNVPVSVDGKLIQSEPIVGDKPHLLDVADILAYTTSHAFCSRGLSDRTPFINAFDAFVPELTRMDFHPQAFLGGAKP